MSLLDQLALPVMVAIVITLLERRFGRRSQDWAINIQAWVINVVVGLSISALLKDWHTPALIDGAMLPAWLAIPAFVLVQDLAEYLFHRAQHRIPWLWAMHSLHHSDPDMSALTTNRHFWADRIIKNLTIWPAAYMVIAPTPAALMVYFGLCYWNFVAHANLPLNFGKWSWVLNSPAYHRRHHSILPEHHNSNFAALFPIFDVMLGSYHRPEGHPPTGLNQHPSGTGELLIWPLLIGRAAKRPASTQASAG